MMGSKSEERSWGLLFSKKAMTEDKAYPQLLKTKTLDDNTVGVGSLDG